MDNNPDLVLGTYGDPSVFYGPSASRVTSPHKESEGGLLSDSPIDGALKAEGSGAMRGFDLSKFCSSPIGVVLIALPFAYVAFHYVFGSRG